MIQLLSESGQAQLICMENNRLRVLLTNFGAAIFSVEIKTADGGLEDIALTCDSLKEFMENRNFYGATVGRVANRIRGGAFSLHGRSYQLTKNDGKNSAHGGELNFSRRFWHTELGRDGVIFTLHSADGDEGYPGNLLTSVRYGFDAEGRIEIAYSAMSDQDTLVGFTNHTYWCLGGLDEKIYPQKLKIYGGFYLETDEELIPTGQILSVKGTPFDFTEPTAVGAHIQDELPTLRRNGGYDVSFVRESRGSGIAAVLEDTVTGRHLEISTTMPTIHLYTGNFLRNEPGKGGRRYQAHDALCLEAGRFPDAIHHAHFGPTVLGNNQKFFEKIWISISR